MQSKTILAIATLATLGTGAKAQDKSSEKDILTIYKGGHSYKEVSVAGKTTGVYVDDKPVAGSEIPHYDSLIQVMRTDVDQQNRDLARSDEEDAREEAQGDRDREEGQQDREQGQQDREQGQRDREQGQRDREQGQRDREQAQRDREQAQDEKEQAQRDREQGKQDREQGERDREQGRLDREQGQRDREQGQRDREQAQKDREQMREMIQFVLDKKIVPDQAHLNGLVLTDSTFYVNGVRQPKDFHQALKAKYPDWAHYGISYGNGCAAGVNIHIGDPDSCCQ